MFDNSIKELSRDVFQLKSTSEIEISTRISKIVVICIFNIENLHEIVMFSSRQAYFMLWSHFRGNNSASVGMVEEWFNQILFNKFMVVLF